tara:strand:- start:3091 stop:4371 length:1281 start_codon:yes stop_codon:yes gene_type:complete
MYKQSPELTLYTVSPLPILSFTIYKLSRIINIKSKIVQESLSNLSSFSQEIFTGIKIVKSYSMQDSTADKFEEISLVNKENQVSLAKMQALFFPLMILLIGVSNIFVIYIGGKQYLDGSIESIGIIAEFIIYVNMLTWPVASLGWISSIVQQAEASQKRINEFLIEKSEIKNVKNGIKKVNGKIEFKNIFFEYSDSNIQALNGISFLIKPKSSLGIIGVTGSGKTTALKLITRSYNISSGEILLDDHSLNKIDLSHLRENIGVVPQDSFLFSDTIINNIRFGNEKATKKEIEKVCKIAGIHKEILKFKDQYKTMLGERGVNLSGGQKQRVCIARALVKKPKILILDDCLSALDTETEEKIIKSLNDYIKDTTTIISSHRISSIQNLDKIIVLKDGKIIQKGSHEELINENGYYKQLYFKQLTEKED